jgi:hypothetical protein
MGVSSHWPSGKTTQVTGMVKWPTHQILDEVSITQVLDEV